MNNQLLTMKETFRFICEDYYSHSRDNHDKYKLFSHNYNFFKNVNYFHDQVHFFDLTLNSVKLIHFTVINRINENLRSSERTHLNLTDNFNFVIWDYFPIIDEFPITMEREFFTFHKKTIDLWIFVKEKITKKEIELYHNLFQIESNKKIEKSKIKFLLTHPSYYHAFSKHEVSPDQMIKNIKINPFFAILYENIPNKCEEIIKQKCLDYLIKKGLYFDKHIKWIEKKSTNKQLLFLFLKYTKKEIIDQIKI